MKLDRRDTHDAGPSPASAVEDQLGGFGAGPEVEDTEDFDFADEHARSSFADQQAGRPGMEPDEDVPQGLSGMDR